jgi:uncharacterized OB-fold protein
MSAQIEPETAFAVPDSVGRQVHLADYRKPIPQPTPETQTFWDKALEGELWLQRSVSSKQAYFPPRPFFPPDPTQEVEWFKATGKGKLHSYVINMRPAPGFEQEAPYAIAVVMLDEGVKMMTNIVECEQTPEALKIDMPVEVVFEKITDTIALPKFKPVSA